MAYRILNELFYPDITNIILDYIIIDLKMSKRIKTMNINYFNDIDDSGETEFLYQHLKIKPKMGRVAIWPGSFTHLHRGNPPNESKYIATGWYASDIGMNHYRPSQR